MIGLTIKLFLIVLLLSSVLINKMSSKKRDTVPTKSEEPTNSGGTLNPTGLLVKQVDHRVKTEIEEVFAKFEIEDRPGFMKSTQLRFALRSFGFEPKKDEIKSLVDKYANKGQIEWISKDNFLRCVLRKFDEKDSNEEILKAFELFDQNGSGQISIHDLKKVAESLGEHVSDQELQEMIAEADLNKDQFVDKHEFLLIMKKTALY